MICIINVLYNHVNENVFYVNQYSFSSSCKTFFTAIFSMVIFFISLYGSSLQFPIISGLSLLINIILECYKYHPFYYEEYDNVLKRREINEQIKTQTNTQVNDQTAPKDIIVEMNESK